MSFHFSPKIVTNGLVLYLDAANPKSYPGSGTTWYDLSGNNINLTLSNASYDTSNYGRMIFSSASNAYASVNNSLLNLYSSGSLEVICNIDNWGSTDFWHIGSKGASAGFDNDGYALWFYGTVAQSASNNIYASCANRDWIPSGSHHQAAIIGNYSLIGNNISQFAMTWNPTSVSGYYNGNLRNTTTFSARNPVGPNVAGLNFVISRIDSLARYTDQNVFIVRVYNRALTQSEIKQNFTTVNPRFAL